MIRHATILLILQLFFVGCKTHQPVTETKYSHFSLTEIVPKTVINDSISRYKAKVESETGRVISFSEGELVKDGSESTLGNFVCDALHYSAKNVFQGEVPDVILVNRGGLRANLPAGEIKVIHIFELMPFENELVLLKISGENLLKFLPLLADKKHPFLGMQVKMNKTEIVSALVNGKEIDKSKVYTIVTSDYLANGGDSFTFLQNPVAFKESGLKIRDAIIRYCDFLKANNKNLKPYKDGRFEVSK